MIHRVLFIMSAVLLVSLTHTHHVHAQDRGPMAVLVDPVVEEYLVQTMPVIGRLVAQRSGVVAARINGPVGQFDVRVGDRVAAGDVMVALVDDSLRARRDLWRAELAEAESRVETRQAELALRRQELERLENLENSSAFNPARVADKRQEVAIAESQLGEFRAAVAITRANLKLAEINLFNVEVRAPYDGVVSSRHTEVGAYVQVGGPVLTLIDDRLLEIEADVPTEQATQLAPGTSVSYRFANAEGATATVRAIVPDESPLTRTRLVRFSAPLSAYSVLATNQSVTLDIPVGAPRLVASVHKDAILDRGGQRVVVVVIDNVAEFQSITLGNAIGSRFEIVDGLSVGDVVVVRGNERVRPGQSLDPGTPDANG